MNESGKALIRQGAYTAVGALAVYATVALGITAFELYRAKHHPKTAASTPCGCGGGK